MVSRYFVGSRVSVVPPPLVANRRRPPRFGVAASAAGAMESILVATVALTPKMLAWRMNSRREILPVASPSSNNSWNVLDMSFSP